MAINNTINNGILTLITKGAKLSTEYNNVYIGLLTTLPTDADHMSGANKDWVEVDFALDDPVPGNPPVSTGYGRYRLAYSTTVSGNTTHYYSQGAHNIQVIQTMPHWDSEEKACIVVNDGDDMMFPNIIETLYEKFPGKSWTVRGFGLFSTANSSTAGDTMIAYGKLVDENGDDTTVTLRAGSVPIFYKDSFKLMLKDGDSGVAGGGN